MLRELNMNEMKVVSGGMFDDSQQLPDTLQGWERSWAESDPLVRSQILGGAGYGGDIEFGGTGEFVYGGNGHPTVTLGSGDISIQCCDGASINVEADLVEVNFNLFDLIRESSTVESWNNFVDSWNGACDRGEPPAFLCPGG